MSVLLLGAAMLGIGLVALAKNKGQTAPEVPEVPAVVPSKDPPPNKGGGFPVPIAVGFGHEAKIQQLHTEMAELFEAQGVDLDLVSPEEVTRMPKAPGQPHAIPPREYWTRMAATLREGFMPIRKAMGVPLTLRGYRPPDYNEAVGGDSGSRHQAFEAVDLRVAKDYATQDKRRELAMVTAELYRREGDRLRMGFGAYGWPVPSNVHVDVGHRQRTWKEAAKYLS